MFSALEVSKDKCNSGALRRPIFYFGVVKGGIYRHKYRDSTESSVFGDMNAATDPPWDLSDERIDRLPDMASDNVVRAFDFLKWLPTAEERFVRNRIPVVESPKTSTTGPKAPVDRCNISISVLESDPRG